MMTSTLMTNIAAEMQVFPEISQKEHFVFVIGALFARLISLRKAAEIMDMEPEVFLKILDIMGLEFSYLSEEDVRSEREW